jgi:hypothetical protein
MEIGTSIFLIALGAVLRFAVTVSTRGFNLHTVGIILMAAGIVGLILSLFWMTLWAERRRTVYAVRRRDGVVREPDLP